MIEENIWDEINITGYTVIDAIYMYFDKLKEAKEHLRSKYDQYALVTFHRAKNIDNPPKPYATL